MKVEKAEGWAVVSKGNILVRTVSDTRRAALVNWLVTEARVLVLTSWTDDDIETAWHKACRGDTQTICTTVSIQLTERL